MKEKNKIIAIILAILIVSTVFILYLETTKKSEKTSAEEAKEVLIDNRISPLENQGLFLEISRIRHRGLLEELIKPLSTSWRNKPKFYAEASSEGVVYSTKDIVMPGATSEIYFETWDTFFMEYNFQFNPDEEQETSPIEITIYENIKSGTLGLRNQDVEKEKINLIYNYRTGRWTGDDNFMDEDGYGHYMGETFELWFRMYQVDYDKDSIPYWAEVNVLGTDPTIDDSKLDPDNDGIPTDWEWYWGYDPFAWDDHKNLDPDIDGIENIEEYQIRRWFADPYHQDIYAEVDNMEGRVLFEDRHIMWEESIQAVIERFSQHNINLYIDQGWPDTPYNGGGSILPFYKTTSLDSGLIIQFYNHYFPEERKDIFHYVIIGNEGGFADTTEENVYHTSNLYINNRMYLNPFKTPNMVPTPRAWRVHLAAMFMHEIGHSIGIEPWTYEGCDNFSSFAPFFTKDWRGYKETWGNYYSAMNYFWVVKNDWAKVLIDYSDGSNADTGYDINDWESIYLPTFQMVSACNEIIGAEPPCLDLCEYELNAKETLEFNLNDWKYDENLTESYLTKIGAWSPIDPIDVTFLVYRKTNDVDDVGNNIRIYGLANVYPTDADYVLIKEGYFGQEENLQFYSQQDMVTKAMSLMN